MHCLRICIEPRAEAKVILACRKLLFLLRNSNHLKNFKHFLFITTYKDKVKAQNNSVKLQEKKKEFLMNSTKVTTQQTRAIFICLAK